MNQNYEHEKEMLDNEWQRIKEQWGQELPPIMTDPKYSF